jgi:hypothetical protein
MSGGELSFPVLLSIVIMMTNIPSLLITWRSRKTTSPTSPTPSPSTKTYPVGILASVTLAPLLDNSSCWPLSSVKILAIRHAHGPGQICVRHQHVVFAVNRHEVFGLGQGNHQLQVFLVSMARGMDVQESFDTRTLSTKPSQG